MPIAAVLLVLGAAAGHAWWNYLAKGARVDAPFTYATVLVSLATLLPVAVAGYAVARPDPGGEVVGLALVSGSLHTLYFWLLTRGYRVGDLSLVYPLSRGTGPVFAVIGGVLIFGERPSPVAVAGIMSVVAGAVLISLPRRVDVHRALPSVGFALATGTIIATYTLWDKNGVSLVTPVLYAFGIEAARTAIMGPYIALSGERRAGVVRAFREQTRAVLGVGILTPLAYLLVLVAFTLAPVSYVAPAREISILFGAAIGLRVLREEQPLRRAAGAAAIVGGVVALAFN
jgi:drug/metabolite transporter (DMT)-like permease